MGAKYYGAMPIPHFTPDIDDEDDEDSNKLKKQRQARRRLVLIEPSAVALVDRAANLRRYILRKRDHADVALGAESGTGWFVDEDGPMNARAEKAAETLEKLADLLERVLKQEAPEEELEDVVSAAEEDLDALDTEEPTEELGKAVWSRAYINDLPDSAFLYIEPGGKKDSEGKTTPRRLRHFPVRDKNGKLDAPHLRNAISRIPQSKVPGLSDADKTKLQNKARKLLNSIKKDEDGEAQQQTSSGSDHTEGEEQRQMTASHYTKTLLAASKRAEALAANVEKDDDPAKVWASKLAELVKKYEGVEEGEKIEAADMLLLFEAMEAITELEKAAEAAADPPPDEGVDTRTGDDPPADDKPADDKPADDPPAADPPADPPADAPTDKSDDGDPPPDADPAKPSLEETIAALSSKLDTALTEIASLKETTVKARKSVTPPATAGLDAPAEGDDEPDGKIPERLQFPSNYNDPNHKEELKKRGLA